MTRVFGRDWLRTLRIAGLALPILLSAARARADAIEDRRSEVAFKGYGFIQTYCYGCHGRESKVEGFDILNRDLLVRRRAKDGTPYLVPGSPEESSIWLRVENHRVPDAGPKPTPEQVALFKKWIAMGAAIPASVRIAKADRPPIPGPGTVPAPTSAVDDLAPRGERSPARPVAGASRKFLGPREVLTAIRDDLNLVGADDRRFIRYATLANLYNLKESGDAEVNRHQLDLTRAALSKVLNSLSWSRDIVVPVAVDAERTVFRIDLRDLGWDESDVWTFLMKSYPYGLQHGEVQDEPLKQVAQELNSLTGGELYWMRADWLIVAATQPGLYEEILRLPKNAEALERKLGVDAKEDFKHNRVVRAGINQSGIATENRLIERHPTLFGAYWRTYDFRPENPRGHLVEFPLGPEFPDNPFADQAFRHDGGEILFNLPNGLQAYMMVDGRGERVAKASAVPMTDPNHLGNGREVVNPLSCMGCHAGGIQVEFKDIVRRDSKLQGFANAKLQKLYPRTGVMDRLLSKDERRYREALENAIRDFLPTRDQNGRPLKPVDPVAPVVQLYRSPLDLDEAAFELGIGDPKAFRESIKGKPEIRELGLGPLTDRKAIKRDLWESQEKDSTRTLFQRVASLIDAGTPFRVDAN